MPDETTQNAASSREPEWEPWELAVRESFAHALAATMHYLQGVYQGALDENRQLRERTKYLEQRVDEEQATVAALKKDAGRV